MGMPLYMHVFVCTAGLGDLNMSKLRRDTRLLKPNV